MKNLVLVQNILLIKITDTIPYQRSVLLQVQIQLYHQMAQNQDKQTFLEAKLCTKCSSMYGHPNFQNMCSLCFKQAAPQIRKDKIQQKLEEHPLLQKQTEEQKKIKQETVTETQIDFDSKKRAFPTQVKEEKSAGKCATCERKTRMLGYNCKHCSREFCRAHRLPQEHQCLADFISLGRKQIKTQNPVICHKKIEQI